MYTFDATPPVITISSPLAGSVLPNKGMVKISATASDASGISKIEILTDGVLKNTCASVSSCQANWNMSQVPAGTHTITVNAADASPSQNAGSLSISVTK